MGNKFAYTGELLEHYDLLLHVFDSLYKHKVYTLSLIHIYKAIYLTDSRAEMMIPTDRDVDMYALSIY